MTIADSTFGCKCISDLFSPMCGTDGKTYDSPCELKCAQIQNPDLEKAHNGACKPICSCPLISAGETGGNNTTQQVDCSAGECVCGTDGNTYQTNCTFSCAQAANPDLEEAYDGPCKHICLCPRIPADGEATDANLKLDCSTGTCVCGSDGNTYQTECSLICARATNPDLEVAYNGPCKQICNCSMIPTDGENSTNQEVYPDPSTGVCPCPLQPPTN